MRRDRLRRWLHGTDVSSPARFVFIALELHADDSGAAYVGVRRISVETGMAGRTVQRALRELVQADDLTVTERTGKASDYKITANGWPAGPVDNPDAAARPPSQSHPTPVTESTQPPSQSHPKAFTTEGCSKAREPDPPTVDNAPAATFIQGTGWVALAAREMLNGAAIPDDLTQSENVADARAAIRAARKGNRT